MTRPRPAKPHSNTQCCLRPQSRFSCRALPGRIGLPGSRQNGQGQLHVTPRLARQSWFGTLQLFRDRNELLIIPRRQVERAIGPVGGASIHVSRSSIFLFRRGHEVPPDIAVFVQRRARPTASAERPVGPALTERAVTGAEHHHSARCK